MAKVRFDFRGEHELLIPDGEAAEACAYEIITGKCYPLPAKDEVVKSVVDLGAHAGEFTVMAALRWADAKVYAYEPNPEVFKMLVENTRQFKGRVFCLPAAVDAIGGRQRMYRHGLGSVAYHLKQRPPTEPQCESFEVSVAAMADVMILKPDVLKLDIEGVEMAVLQSVADLLPAVNRIYVEFHGEEKRIGIEQLLLPSHYLGYCRLNSYTNGCQGELMYVKRKVIR